MTSFDTPKGFLKVDGSKIVNHDGQPLILKGCATGGHLNMENFITGFPGHEFEVRRAMKEAMGEEKYNFVFDKWTEYFFTSSDAKFIKSLGMNCVRIPFNHRHFISDRSPSVINSNGFKLLDRVINACATEGLYTILDLHTAPGGQNQAWHCDSGLHKAVFWDYSDHQDRVVQLWTAIAKYYASNTWIAGYNPLNEPASPEQDLVPAFYERLEKAIRSVDANHILFLDGNTYSMDFSAFNSVLPNTVYSFHDYASYGFPMKEQYIGTAAQKELLQRQFDRKMAFMKEKGVPGWDGEFGPVYAGEFAGAEEGNHEEINQRRYNLLGQQLEIHKKAQIGWSIWLWKDIGFQGLVYTSPHSPYVRLLKPFLEKKVRMGLDRWGRNDKHVQHIYEPLITHLQEEIPDHLHNKRYPHMWNIEGHVMRVVREMFVSEVLTYEFASYFKDKTLHELDEIAASFKFENCIQREALNEILKLDAHD